MKLVLGYFIGGLRVEIIVEIVNLFKEKIEYLMWLEKWVRVELCVVYVFRNK